MEIPQTMKKQVVSMRLEGLMRRFLEIELDIIEAEVSNNEDAVNNLKNRQQEIKETYDRVKEYGSDVL